MLSLNPTKQEVFEFGLAAIIKQGGPSFNRKYNTCEYNAPDGNKCVIGHMLPSTYIPRDGNNYCSINSLMSRGDFPKELSWMKSEKMWEFLRKLQSCHDSPAKTHSGDGIGGTYIPEFVRLMKNLASKEGIVFPETQSI